jgi:nitrogen fixation protein FixH
MTAYDQMSSDAPSTGDAKLTGWTVLGILVAFFAVIASVNGVMIYAALSTFRGEVVSKPYERGLAYNRDIEHAREQARRDWRVEAKVARSANGAAALRVVMRDATGAPVTGAAVQATLASPADKKQDVSVALTEVAPGRFEGEAPIAAGWRDLLLIATRKGEEVYRSKNRILIGASS